MVAGTSPRSRSGGSSDRCSSRRSMTTATKVRAPDRLPRLPLVLPVCLVSVVCWPLTLTDAGLSIGCGVMREHCVNPRRWVSMSDLTPCSLSPHLSPCDATADTAPFDHRRPLCGDRLRDGKWHARCSVPRAGAACHLQGDVGPWDRPRYYRGCGGACQRRRCVSATASGSPLPLRTSSV